MATIYLDIETLPALDWDDERKQRQVRDKVPKNYKDPEKIAQWIAEESDAVWRRTALSPLYGRILCVCVAIGDHDPHVYWSDGTLEGERGVLIELTGLVSRLDVQVAHNGHGFDFPWLRKRALKHRLTGLVSMYNVQQSWKATHLVDTLEVWAGPSRDREGASLDGLAEFFGIKRDNPISGADVYDRWVMGDHDAIKHHVKDDVRVLREVYRCLAI